MPATLSTKKLGNNIRKAREAAKMTQLELAHALKWEGPDAGAQISKYEAGDTEPRFSTLSRIAKALGCTVESLLPQ